MQLSPSIIRCMSPEDRAIYDPMKLTEPPPPPDDGKQTGLEKELQRLCEQDLGRRGIWYLHLSPRAREKAGVPDLIFSVPDSIQEGWEYVKGGPWAVELKTATGVLSAEQKATLEHMGENGWRTAVVRSFSEWRSVVFRESDKRRMEMTRTEELLTHAAQIRHEEREDTKRYVDGARLRKKRRKAIETELRQIREGKNEQECDEGYTLATCCS